MEVLAIIISLILLMYLAYRGWSVILIAPLLAMLAVILSGEVFLLGVYTEVFMKGLGNFIIKYFPIFLLGAIFGKLVDKSGAAQTIAQWILKKLGKQQAILAIVLSCAILTYGGVSIFIVAFGIYPMAKELFIEVDIPKRLIPAAIGLGSFTFSMTTLPGTVQIHNIIPIPYFQTDAFAGATFGIIAGFVIVVLGMTWLNFQVIKAKANHEGYGFSGDQSDTADKKLPPLFLSLLPILLLILLNFAFSQFLIPNWDTSYLQEIKFGSTTLDNVKGIWAIIMSMGLAIVILILTLRSYIPNLNGTLSEGINSSFLPIFNTASEVGYGTSIAALAGFENIKNWVLGLFTNMPLMSVAIAVNILAGITGSASGGLAIAMETLGANFLISIQEQGIDPGLMHRVSSMASSGLDSLPHNGAVITLLMICGLNHKQSYFDIFMVTLLIPLSVLFGMILVVSV